MRELYAYTVQVAALAVLCALFECLIPQGNLKKVVLFALGLLFLIGISAPLLTKMTEMPLDLSWPNTSAASESFDGEAKSHTDLLQEYYDGIVSDANGR